MPFSRLCYALLHETEESLFPLKSIDVHFQEELNEEERDTYYDINKNPKSIDYNIRQQC